MAKRSDFAQKLLDDLRLRKERIAASQSSKGSKSMSGDAYAYSKQTHRGSREMKTNQVNGFRNSSTHNRSRVENKSLYIEDASKEIVPFGRGNGSQQMGDLSVALAFALENGGKLTRMESSGNTSIFGLLNQMGRRRSVDLSRMGNSSFDRQSTSTNHFPTVSQLHIQEIAKGAQKLNQILRACSNGLNFDRYSIEIGKELLKGAMDLEESLRMLVNLQEASECMIRPQNKNRITLLDEEEDDSDTINTVEQKQLGLPIFSFDRRSRNAQYIQEVARTDLKQRLMALSYLSEAINSNNDAHIFNTSNSVSHKQSRSYGSTVKTSATHSDKKSPSTSKSNPENKRISNVIAKLMGLQELPESKDSKQITQKDSGSKPRSEGMVARKTVGGNTTHDRKEKEAEHVVPRIKRQEKIQSNQIQVIPETTNAMQTERSVATRHTSFEENINEGATPKKAMGGTRPLRGSSKENSKMDRNQYNILQRNQSTGSQRKLQEKQNKQDDTKHKEQKGKEKGENKDLASEHELQHLAENAQNASDVSSTFQVQTESTHRTVKKEASKLLFNNQANSYSMLHKFDPQDIKHHATETPQQHAKQNIPVKREKGSEAMPKLLKKPTHDAAGLQKKHLHMNQSTPGNRSSTKPTEAMKLNGFPHHLHHEDPAQYRSSNNFNKTIEDSKKRESSQISSTGDIKSEFTKEKANTPAMKEKSIPPSAIQRVKNTKIEKVESLRKADEIMIRNGIPHNLAKPSKHHIPMLQEVKPRRGDKATAFKQAEQVRVCRSKEAEADIVKSEKSMASIQQSIISEEVETSAEQASKSYNNPTVDECKSTKEPQVHHPSCQNMTSTVTNEEGQSFGRDKLSSHNIVVEKLNTTHEGGTDVNYPSQLHSQKKSRVQPPDPLTECENRLKQILIQNQLFLNTAEALFKLNIPYGILHAGGNDCHDEESKFVLDCGYEILKRRGKTLELSIYPLISKFNTYLKINSLEELIKQLNKDLKNLKFYGRNENVECLVEDYLPKMLECDVYNNIDPDLNCMWDLGWEKMMFCFQEKDEVIRDVEKHVLNGLLDEVTRDLMLVY